MVSICMFKPICLLKPVDLQTLIGHNYFFFEWDWNCCFSKLLKWKVLLHFMYQYFLRLQFLRSYTVEACSELNMQPPCLNLHMDLYWWSYSVCVNSQLELKVLLYSVLWNIQIIFGLLSGVNISLHKSKHGYLLASMIWLPKLHRCI